MAVVSSTLTLTLALALTLPRRLLTAQPHLHEQADGRRARAHPARRVMTADMPRYGQIWPDMELASCATSYDRMTA